MPTKNTTINKLTIFTLGNPSRGDDAIGPKIFKCLTELKGLSIELLLIETFQLQPEHCCDIEGSSRVLFIDADSKIKKGFSFSQLKKENKKSYTSHAMPPEELLNLYHQVNKTTLPAFLLGIGAHHFELGSEISHTTKNNIKIAWRFLEKLLNNTKFTDWENALGSYNTDA